PSPGTVEAVSVTSLVLSLPSSVKVWHLCTSAVPRSSALTASPGTKPARLRCACSEFPPPRLFTMPIPAEEGSHQSGMPCSLTDTTHAEVSNGSGATGTGLNAESWLEVPGTMVHSGGTSAASHHDHGERGNGRCAPPRWQRLMGARRRHPASPACRAGFAAGERRRRPPPPGTYPAWGPLRAPRRWA